MEQPKSKKVLRKKKKTKKKVLDEDVERLKMEKEEDKEKMLLVNSIVTKCNLSEEKVMIFNWPKLNFTLQQYVLEIRM